ncbi:metal-dependent hydrolase [Crassaminicella profunda]|uniref:metal-dependent hydrolase n=1 Tax=Crassaminicella profunda TaxID=1286698 RepID=UPI001CA6FF4B|nr:metal-dependent hydrolase [Crassaminicella profunda]QZY56374.1 metal-dependent hydrolase [Crassaminicella profunda]
MNGKTHMLFGSVASLYLLPKLGYEPALTTTAAALIGSLIPDMDHPKAKINQKILPMKNRVGKVLFYCSIGGFLLYRYGLDNRLTFALAIILILIGLSQHRSFTHSILGMGSIASIAFFVLKNTLPLQIILSFIIGLISHLVGDFMTIAGIELFYPLSNKKYRFILTISSGNMAETFICIFFIYLIVSFFIQNGFSMNFIYSIFNIFH